MEDDFGKEAFDRRQAQILDAFSDMEWTAHEVFADCETGCVQYTFMGTHTGVLESIAPVLKRVTISGVTIAWIADGKVVELWAHPDRLGLLQQLGVIPTITAH